MGNSPQPLSPYTWDYQNRPIQTWAMYFPSSNFHINFPLCAMNLFPHHQDWTTTLWRLLRPVSWEQLTRALCMLLQLSGYDQNSYASRSFRIEATTTANMAGLPAWLIEAMGWWSSDAYKTYIQYLLSPASTLQAIPHNYTLLNKCCLTATVGSWY